MSQVERLNTEMTKAGADLSSQLIAFGGGESPGDLSGFVSAAPYARDRLHPDAYNHPALPSGFLGGGQERGQSANGQKPGGQFLSSASAVFGYRGAARTLPPARELRAGIYESIKAGLIRDAALFRFIESHRELIDKGDPASIEKMVAVSIRIKAEVVTLDERELGVRMVLNFGHTLGHAIEATSGYRALLHGEAIAWGMIAALDICRRRNMVTEAAARRIETLIRSFQPPPLPSVSPKRLLQAASGDKKNRAGVRRFVLLQGLGNAMVAEDVSDTEVLAAIASIRRLSESSK